MTLLVVAQQMGISEEKIHESLKASQQPMSLETPRNEENDHDLGDVLEDQMAASPTDIIAHHQHQEYVADALQDLSEREWAILQLSYGLLDGTSHTLTEIGEMFQMSRERVRQIETKALKKLRVKRSNQFKDFSSSEQESITMANHRYDLHARGSRACQQWSFWLCLPVDRSGEDR